MKTEQKINPELIQELHDKDLLWYLLSGMDRNMKLIDGVCDVIETYEDLEVALEKATTIKELLPSINVGEWPKDIITYDQYVDNVMAWHHELLDNRPEE